MLSHLTVRNIVLIEELVLDFADGLTVLTGETGAGKSILLDALGLALGARANFDLIRSGTERASVTARFEISSDHPVWSVLDGAGIEQTEDLILKRQLRQDGKSPATINDEPVSVSLLKQCGDMLIEIQGQFEGRGLLDPANHIGLLDRACDHSALLDQLSTCWHDWQSAKQALVAAREALDSARQEEDWLRDAVAQLDALKPEADEEDLLVAERSLHANAGKIAEALQMAHAIISDEEGMQTGVGRALAALERVSDLAGGQLDASLDALSRALSEMADAEAEMTSAADKIDGDPARLEFIDERLHALRTQARKLNVSVEALPEQHSALAARLAAMDDQSGHLAALAEVEETSLRSYRTLAEQISHNRHNMAQQLDNLVMSELPPLKLEAARFVTEIEIADETRWNKIGWDKVRFTAATNPGQAAGPIDKVASGGELARFLLALKVVVAASEPSRTLIFDEVDSGVGGAVADAVGERLSRLGTATQNLVITHSPQVAARGNQHLKIAKSQTDDSVISATRELFAHERIEEVARMLSGAQITEEARAAAKALLAAG